MKYLLVLSTFTALAMVASAAPAKESAPDAAKELESEPAPVRREKRSSYAQPVYTSPCAASSAIHGYGGPAYHIAPAQAYGGGGIYSPHAAYSSYGYAPHYRADDGDEEMMTFSDGSQPMFEQAFGRSYGGYDVVPAASQFGGSQQYVAPVATGPAYGVFPKAQTGGCSVPLLLTCSPSIVPGKLVRNEHTYGAASQHYGGVSLTPAGASLAAPGAYRGVDEHQLVNEASGEQSHPSEQHSSPHEAAAARHASAMTIQ